MQGQCADVVAIAVNNIRFAASVLDEGVTNVSQRRTRLRRREIHADMVTDCVLLRDDLVAAEAEVEALRLQLHIKIRTAIESKPDEVGKRAAGQCRRCEVKILCQLEDDQDGRERGTDNRSGDGHHAAHCVNGDGRVHVADDPFCPRSDQCTV